jgi:3-hydroxyisobutyrate dehydrogenase-like beta-hydroxyacid dehydrogenase
MSRIGFIGLGIMGAPMAGHLLAASSTAEGRCRPCRPSGERSHAPAARKWRGAPRSSGGFAASRILEVHGERMIKRKFEAGFRIELHQKDLNLALSSARQVGLSLPNTATAQELFNACAARGGKGWDHSAMVRALECLGNHEIAAA